MVAGNGTESQSSYICAGVIPGEGHFVTELPVNDGGELDESFGNRR